MDDDDLEELRMLRARAYGPSADIHDDASALQRLHDLEATARESTTGTNTPRESTSGQSAAPIPPHPGPPPPLPADLRRVPSAPRARLTEPAVTIAGAPAAASRPRVAPRRWYLSRGFAVLWVVSLVAVASVAAGMTFAAAWIMPISRQGNAQQIAVLRPDPDFVWAPMFESHDGASGFTFHGISIIGGGGDLFSSGPDAAPCVLAYVAGNVDDQTGIDGPAWSACGAGTFPPTVQFAVDETLPQELRDTVGDDVAVQFVLDGERLAVFTAPLIAAAPSATD
ncbi:hypothetical protein PU630_12685 [Microbacterium horticulturae]|uniref:Uncharacterized protein n=1 Tax=Microbacterium horticulturae TaxID=3028316 RepID=A0ABY8BW14_9MICO|nr:hypothetical protein [Microbacterium sp. KACC 23027]WEG08090.1 hypothetical protein PU630_12685 [Microbacterium sp. KACC 23027]